jgi:putative transposase
VAGTAPHADRTARERYIGAARGVVLRYIDDYARRHGVRRGKAIFAFLAAAKARELPETLMIQVAVANDKNGFVWAIKPDPAGFNQISPESGQDTAAFVMKLSKKTLYRWFKLRDVGGPKALMPVHPRKDFAVQSWHALALELRQRPQGMSLSAIAEAIQKQLGEGAVSYWQVYRFFKEKFSAIDQLKGRHTGSDLAVHKFCHRRTADGMAPMDEVHADGWSTHFTAPHPVNGDFVVLECWHFHDFATRFVFPPSVGLSESFLVIARGLEHCIRVGGVPAVLQTDSTGSVKNDRMSLDPVSSIAARAGLHITHPRVGNSQGNGICENFNKYLDSRSKELATYQHPSMDGKVHRNVRKLVGKMVKAHTPKERLNFKRQVQRTGKGLVFDSYQQAVDWLTQVCEEFNDKPHSFLPKIRDPQTGLRRHQTPREAWNQALAQGAELTLLDEDDLQDLFRPHERVTVRRGAVTLYGQRYWHPDLEHWNGHSVQVAYDIMDGSKVWVKDRDGMLIGEAALYESRNPRPRSVYEMAFEKRADAQLKRLSKKAEAIEAQRPSTVLDHLPSTALPRSGDTWPTGMPNDDNVTELIGVSRPMFAADYEKYEWLMDRPREISREDQGWLAWYRTTSEWEDLYGHMKPGALYGKEAVAQDSDAT